MSYFSELLNYYSKRCGVNSPQIASYCNLDRVTVYRFIKGKTLPKDKDTVSKIAEFLQLTTDERDVLSEAYECSRLGPKIYWERRYIYSFIKSFSGTAPTTPIIQFDTSHLKDLHGETLVLGGRDETIQRIQKEILNECEKPRCEISLRMSAYLNIVMDLLLAAGKKNSALKINHLIPIAVTSSPEKYAGDYNVGVATPVASYLSIREPFTPSLYSIPYETRKQMKEVKKAGDISTDAVWIGEQELLQNIFKVVRLCAEDFDYEPSYYYTRQGEIGQFPSYSNLLITQSSVILFTDDLEESIVLSDPVYVTSFQKKYQKLAEDKPYLFFFFQDVKTLIKRANDTVIQRTRKMEEVEYYYSSLPCILPVVTDQIIEKHLSMDLVTRMQNQGEDVLKSLYEYVASIRTRYLKDDFNEIVYFSESGLRAFMKTGRMSDVPPELYSPLTEEERKQMLLALADHPNLKFRILKKELSAPEGMLGIEVMDSGLFITFYHPEKGMCFLYINEPGIYLAFKNFFKSLPGEDLYSYEVSKEILRTIAQETV